MSEYQFSSSYRQYKEDTNAFTTWLGRAAAACGYKSGNKKKLSESGPAQASSASGASRPASTASAAPVSAGRMKGKARKAAQKAEAEAKRAQAQAEELRAIDEAFEKVKTATVIKYATSTEELLAQIETVHQSKKTRMPAAVSKVLERAIKARERCAAWYEKAKGDDEDDGHRHFINLLREALATLGSNGSTQPAKAYCIPKNGEGNQSKESLSLE
jgi:succinate dehydrogenase/fumarate reductase flavoprotein subunit